MVSDFIGDLICLPYLSIFVADQMLSILSLRNVILRDHHQLYDFIPGALGPL